jgi:hypothetical protein
VPPRRTRTGEEREGPFEPGRGPGKDRAVYLDYLQGRWLGSAPPTAQAYAHALNLWRQLPGALPIPPGEPSAPDGGGDDGVQAAAPTDVAGDEDRQT